MYVRLLPSTGPGMDACAGRQVPRGRALACRGRPRVGLAGWVLVLLALSLIGCTTALASGSREIRVLLYDSPDPVEVGPKEALVAVSASADGLVVDDRVVGPRWSPEGSGPWRVARHIVRGRISLRAERGRIQVVNRVGLEQYVASTVGGEMSPSWPREALRAQAVAARTYVLHEAAKRARSPWDVRATTSSQVYRGLATETDETRAAARATRGEVLTWRGEPILAVFHSTAGGRTATAGEVWGRDLPYLRVVEVDEEDDAPHTYWRIQFARDDLARVFGAAGIDVGIVEGLSVTRRTPSGRVERLEIRGPGRREDVRGARLRSLLSSLGLRSTLFDIKTTAEGFAFVGSGHGHGVGMSQWGARAMAERGESYRRILARFYQGARLEQWSAPRLAGSVSAVGTNGANEEN